MGVLGKDLLDFHRPRTNTKVEFGASGYWVESHPTMQPYGAVLTEILNLDAAPFQELLDQYRKTVAEKDAEQAARAFQAVTNGFASLPLYRLYWNDVQLFASMDVRELFVEQKEFKVSTDYILGLSTLSVRKSYDISELGLSEGAVRGLVTGTVDVQILNRLLEHRNFPKLMDLIRIYFQDTAAKGIMARNQLIELATASLSDLMKEHPEHRAEARQDLQFLNAQKMGEHEAEIEKIKNVFLSILRDIKKDMDSGEQPGEAVTAAMFQTMQDALAEQKQEPLSMDDVTAMIAGQIGQLLPMDEETAEQFQQLAKRMMEQAGK